MAGQRQGRCGVAGDHQQVDVLCLEKTRGADGITGHGLRGLGAVGQAGGIAEIQIVSRQLLGHGLQHGKAANAGIEYADARKCH